MKTRLLLLTGALSWLLSPAESNAQPAAPLKTTAAEFLARHGAGWRVVAESLTGQPAFVYGKRFSLALVPRDEAGFETAARLVVDQNFALFGFDSSNLRIRRVSFLNLSRVGSSDKVAVVFDQVVDELAVFNGSVSILFDQESGDVLAVRTTCVPFAELVNPFPASSSEEALQAAQPAFLEAIGVPFTSVDHVAVAIVGPSTFFGADNPINATGPVLAYLFDLSAPGLTSQDGLPAVARVIVSAAGDRSVFKVFPTVHADDISGKVMGYVNLGPGMTPSASVLSLVDLPHVAVYQQGSPPRFLTETDEEGSFLINSVSGAIDLQFELKGRMIPTTGGVPQPSILVSDCHAYGTCPFIGTELPDIFACSVDCGPSSIETVFGATGSGNKVVFNSAVQNACTTAEVNAYYSMDRFRTFVEEQLGTGSAADPLKVPLRAAVNLNVEGTTGCHGRYWKDSPPNDLMGFGRGSDCAFSGGAEGGTCNTGTRATVLHEMGHWAMHKFYGNTIYGGIRQPLNEGLADTWSFFIRNDPCQSSRIDLSECTRNAKQEFYRKCPDLDELCQTNDSHQAGQAISSALWAVREQLRQVGCETAAGVDTANALLVAWMSSFDNQGILDVFQDQWVCLDDQNGDLSDGTPHLEPITIGFQSRGWPELNLSYSGTSAYGCGYPGTGGVRPDIGGFITTDPQGDPKHITVNITSGLPHAIGALYVGNSRTRSQLNGSGTCLGVTSACLLVDALLWNPPLKFLLDSTGSFEVTQCLGSALPCVLPVDDLYFQALIADGGAPGGRPSATGGLMIHLEPSH